MSESPAVGGEAAVKSVLSALAGFEAAIAAATPLPVSPGDVGATPTTTSYPPLPAYALKHAPYLWLHHEERHWPGDPRTHLQNTHPYTKEGVKIDVPEDIAGTTEVLELPQVKNSDVFLVLDDDPREGSETPALVSIEGIPDDSRRSESACWIIAVDKSKVVGEGTMDIFYFFFYPYNLGNFVACTTFGNHVGDWEHSMVRFKDGLPIGVHLSAHANGHSWAWETVEKMDGRPVGYVARGSHAMYGRAASHHYSPVPLVGPVDYTARGKLWDPTLNYVATSYTIETDSFSPLSPPTPDDPHINTSITHRQALSILSFPGRWGNSFSDIREKRDKIRYPWSKNAEPEKRTDHTLSQKLEMLRWAEAPTGPKAKSLERQGMSWNTLELLKKL